MKIDLPHIKRYTARGKTYYYHRRTGIRIEGEPGTIQFQLAYEKACEVARHRKTETFATLISNYFSSQKFQCLGERTRADYNGHRPIIEAAWATMPLEVMKDKRIKGHFRKWRDALSETKGARQADLIFATCRRIVSFAVDDGILENNPLLAIDSIYKADRSDMIWLPEHIEAFFNTASQGMQLALILALNLGRREGDLIRLTWGDYTGEFMHVTNRKGRRKAKFPARVTEALRASLDAYKRSLGRIAHKDEPILTTNTGAVWTEGHFSSKFSAAKNEAGLKDLHFHDLRGTAVTILAENGCTAPEIASISGHSMKNVEGILEKYMARTRALNDAATKKLEETWVAKLVIR